MSIVEIAADEEKRKESNETRRQTRHGYRRDVYYISFSHVLPPIAPLLLFIFNPFVLQLQPQYTVQPLRAALIFFPTVFPLPSPLPLLIYHSLRFSTFSSRFSLIEYTSPLLCLTLVPSIVPVLSLSLSLSLYPPLFVAFVFVQFSTLFPV